MTDEEAYNIIGERTQQIAEELKRQIYEMYKNGLSIEWIEKYVYALAIGTLKEMQNK